MESQARIEDSDPARADLAAIIDAMRKCFDERSATPSPTAREIVARTHLDDVEGQELAAALRPHMRHGIINANAVSHLLGNRRDTITDGFRIRRERDNHAKLMRFRVERILDKPGRETRP